MIPSTAVSAEEFVGVKSAFYPHYSGRDGHCWNGKLRTFGVACEHLTDVDTRMQAGQSDVGTAELHLVHVCSRYRAIDVRAICERKHEKEMV